MNIYAKVSMLAFGVAIVSSAATVMALRSSDGDRMQMADTRVASQAAGTNVWKTLRLNFNRND